MWIHRVSAILLIILVCPPAVFAQAPARSADDDPLQKFPLSVEMLGVAISSPPPLWYVSREAIRSDPEIKGTALRLRPNEKSEMIYFYRPRQGAEDWTEMMEIAGMLQAKPSRHAVEAMDLLMAPYVSKWCAAPVVTRTIQKQETTALSILWCADYRGPVALGGSSGSALTMVVRLFLVKDALVWIAYRWRHPKYDPNDLSETYPVDSSILMRAASLLEAAASISRR